MENALYEKKMHKSNHFCIQIHLLISFFQNVFGAPLYAVLPPYPYGETDLMLFLAEREAAPFYYDNI